VGAATVRFDGTTCVYDGPTAVMPGPLVLGVQAGDQPFAAVVAHLVPGATLDEAVQWSVEHPGEAPPMVDQVAVVGDPGSPTTARVDLQPGENAVVCATPEGGVVAGAVVTAG
jgi:hypothetical protein